MSFNIWKRLTATSLSNRYYQITNGLINGFAGKQLQIKHLVEYPRCGGTWVRHLLQDSMDIRQYAYDRLLSKNTIIQCHKLPNPTIRRAVVIFRDPRDATVSFYHKKVSYDKKFRGNRPLKLGDYTHNPDRDPKEDFLAFLRVHLVSPDHPRFSFGDFANRWLATSHACFTKYETFKESPVPELKRLTQFLGADVPQHRLEAAVEKNSFANRTKRRSGTVRRPGQSDNHQFERKGIVGDWRNLFNLEARRIFCEHEGETLIRLEYEHNNHWADEHSQS